MMLAVSDDMLDAKNICSSSSRQQVKGVTVEGCQQCKGMGSHSKR